MKDFITYLNDNQLDKSAIKKLDFYLYDAARSLFDRNQFEKENKLKINADPISKQIRALDDLVGANYLSREFIKYKQSRGEDPLKYFFKRVCRKDDLVHFEHVQTIGDIRKFSKKLNSIDDIKNFLYDNYAVAYIMKWENATLNGENPNHWNETYYQTNRDLNGHEVYKNLGIELVSYEEYKKEYKNEFIMKAA